MGGKGSAPAMPDPTEGTRMIIEEQRRQAAEARKEELKRQARLDQGVRQINALFSPRLETIGTQFGWEAIDPAAWQQGLAGITMPTSDSESYTSTLDIMDQFNAQDYSPAEGYTVEAIYGSMPSDWSSWGAANRQYWSGYDGGGGGFGSGGGGGGIYPGVGAGDGTFIEPPWPGSGFRNRMSAFEQYGGDSGGFSGSGEWGSGGGFGGGFGAGFQTNPGVQTAYSGGSSGGGGGTSTSRARSSPSTVTGVQNRDYSWLAAGDPDKYNQNSGFYSGNVSGPQQVNFGRSSPQLDDESDDGSGGLYFAIMDDYGNTIGYASSAAGLRAGQITWNPEYNVYGTEEKGFGDQWFGNYQDAYLDYYNPQVEDQYSGSLEELTYDAARSGLLRSSAVTDAQADYYGQYLDNKALIESQADAVTGQMRNKVEQSKQSALSQLYATEDPELAAANALGNINNMLRESPRLDPLGNLFDPIRLGMANFQQGFQQYKGAGSLGGTGPSTAGANPGGSVSYY